MRVAAAAPAALALTLAAPVRAHPSWPDGFVVRLEAHARLQELNSDLLSHDSATATLQRFCDRHGGRPGLKIAARRMPGPDKPAGPAERAALQVGPEAPLRYRRVALMCGEAILSQADNWYRPERLTAQMNQLLDETDTPFGVAAAPLAYKRRTIESRALAQALPEGWESQPPEANAGPWTAPAQVLEHRALLSTPDGVPLSLVVETYSATLLALPQAIGRIP